MPKTLDAQLLASKEKVKRLRKKKQEQLKKDKAIALPALGELFLACVKDNDEVLEVVKPLLLGWGFLSLKA